MTAPLTHKSKYFHVLFGLLLVLSGCGGFGESSSTTTQSNVEIPLEDQTIQAGCPKFTGSPTAGAELGLNNNVQKGDVAQSFRITEDREVRELDLYLMKRLATGESTLPGKVIVRIETSRLARSIEGQEVETPSGEMIAEAEVEANKIEVSESPVNFKFSASSKVILKANTRYWIRVRADYPSSDSTLALWGASTSKTQAPYGPGRALVYKATSPAGWTSVQGATDKASLRFRFGCVTIEK